MQPYQNDQCDRNGANRALQVLHRVPDAAFPRCSRMRENVLGFPALQIEFGPGRVEHTYTQVRGAVPKWDGQCVYLTGTTPFEFTLKIT